MALADLEGAPVHLGPLNLEHPLASYGTLWGMVSRHYTRQVLQGVYKVRTRSFRIHRHVDKKELYKM